VFPGITHRISRHFNHCVSERITHHVSGCREEGGGREGGREEGVREGGRRKEGGREEGGGRE